jgi:hypothetical protein
MVTVVSGCEPHRIAMVDNSHGTSAVPTGRVNCPLCDASR